jgi:general secretion pathway protein D
MVSSRPFILSVFACLHLAAASSSLEQAQKAEAAGDKLGAYILYQRAATERPSDPAVWAKMRALRSAFLPTLPVAQTGIAAAPQIVISSLTGTITGADLAESRSLEGPPVLSAAKPDHRSFHVRGEVKKLFEDVTREYGLIVIFERDLNSASPAPTIRFDVDDADYKTAIHALSRATNTFATPISEKILLVAQDNVQKRQEYEQTVARVFSIPQRTSVQEAQELMQAVQQTLEIRRIVVDQQKRQILVRDRRSKVELAALLLEEMSNYKPQIEIEMEMLTANLNTSRNLGVTLPNSSALVSFGNVTDKIGFFRPSNFLNFMTFGGGTTFMGLGLGSAQLLADYTKSESNSILRSMLMASDGQAATLHIGDKYPIVTSQFVGPSAKPGQNSVIPPPAFNFEELGLVLKVTPFIHGPDEVTLELEAEFKVLGAGGFNGIPVINTRKFQSKLRLTTKEWAVVAGLVSESDARTLSGMAGLANIPILGPILSRNGKETTNSQVLLLLKPRIVSMPPSERVTKQYWFGSETRPLSPL